jgi:hypothetical protein
MPSARELLEQADALMRRNRSPLMDDIPVLTDSVREIPPGRPLQPRRTEPDFDAPDTIPMLTDSVDDAPEEPVAPAPAVTKEAVVEEGEPSDWLQLGGAEPSIIGEAPDSIAIVPPVEQQMSEEIEVEAPPEVEEAFDAELAAREAPPAAPPAPSTHEADEHQRIEATDVQVPERDTPAWAEDTLVDMAAHEQEVASSDVDEPVDIAPEVVDDAPPPLEAFVLPPAEEAPPQPTVEPGPTPAERQAEDDARWASMAEEIRMQVLQRIDLFTDTGLRDQLGARLQPIVDRASADLVATINQHVGDLLRSYVAEAIEREIENWRRGN